MATKKAKNKSVAKKTTQPAKAKIVSKPKPVATKAPMVAKVVGKTAAAPKKITIEKSKTKTTTTKTTGDGQWSKVFKPLEDRVLVEVVEAETRTPGGLYIPQTVDQTSTRAKVLSVGIGKRNKKGVRRPLDVKAGDTVLFSEYAGTKINISGHDVLILAETDILGIEQ